MNLRIAFAAVASLIAALCTIPYIADIFRLKTTPHSYSWLVWTLLQVTSAFAMLSGGAGIGAIPTAIGGGLCAFVFLLSLRYGTKNITAFDAVCLVGALLTTAVWFFSRNALLSIMLTSVIDFLAFLPTFRKSYAEPYSETVSLYLLSGIANGLSLFALGTVNPTTVLYPITLVVTNFFCVGIISFRRRQFQKNGFTIR